MARGKKPAAKGNGNGADLGFEPTLWAAADKPKFGSSIAT
jgi:hypothetical protein